MTNTTDLTDQQLDEYEALANNATLLGADIASPNILAVLVAEVRRLRAAVPAAVEPPADRTALRQHIADTIRAAACPGDCGQTEEECARQRIQPGAWHHGVLVEVEGRPELFADAVLAALPEHADRAPSIPSPADTAPADESPHIYMTAIRQQAGWVHAFTKAGRMTEALEHVEAMERLLAVYRRAVGVQAQPRTDDPDHRHAAALHFLGKPIPTDDQDGDRP